MKFAHSLILNAVPEWLDKYVDYDRLKKIVYQTEQKRIDQQNFDARSHLQKIEEGFHEKRNFKFDEEGAATDEDNGIYVNMDNEYFLNELDIQLQKVSKFFVAKKKDFFDDADELEVEFHTFNIPLPDETRQPLLESISTQTALERLNSEHNKRKKSSSESGTKDLHVNTFFAPTSDLEAEADEDMSSGPLYSSKNAEAKYNTPKTIHKHSSVMSSSIEDNNQNNTINKRAFSLSPLVGRFSAAHAPLRSNTINSTTLRSRRGSRIEKSLSEHGGMSSYTEDIINTPPTRIMQSMGFRRRKNSHISLYQPDNVNEFNQFYNFRVRCAATYIALTELKSYANINRTAFDKILKKWDKVTGYNLRESYLTKIVNNVEAFSEDNSAQFEQRLEHILSMYAAIFTVGNKHNAEVELKMHMRDHIQFERTTVWKDLVGKERQTLDAHATVPQRRVLIPIIHIFINRQTISNIIGFLISITSYIVLMCIDTMGHYEASKCLALLIFAALMWASECIPLFATAFLIPLMIVPMKIIRDSSGSTISASSAAKLVFSQMFNDTIMILIGGFAIAAALSKHGIAKAFAATVLSKAGSKPRWVILVNMYLAAFLCMWISNVATPVLCFSLAEPILRTLKPNSKVAPCLIMGIALASCIGGLLSPISSPQNIITINLMNPSPSWGIWFVGAIPCGFITILTTWILLLLYFRPDFDTPYLNVIKSQHFSRPSLSQIWVCLVSLATIALWCAESALNDFWGDNGVIGAIPFVLLFGTKMLNKNDLNNFLWSVIILAQGGMALGYAVNSSGLLDVIGHQIAGNVNNLSALSITFIFGMLVLVFSTFVSHTVAALIILPIVSEVGQHLPVPRPNLMVMTTGLVCSVAMGLPVSGFPNMNAIMLEDPTGKPYLKIKDFILIGIPSSLVAAVITICLSYGIISSIGY
ncbi:SPX domain-containing protein [Cokeromyces recurvatus]|uniref:SPX domain-containing protein n=1 Tax=Cokeromyces recurvatus TaxID=90255 RepID=UPI00221EFCB3|nr:SPX domain-containing protein [Cokeromyces recurvatus]KAI7899605.1 SPX domain-containing protein [Cokeromyces recurvatus]